MQNIEPDICVRGYDIARACEGYIRSVDTKVRSYIFFNTGPVRILYTIYSIMVTSLIQTIYYCNNSFTTYVFALSEVYVYLFWFFLSIHHLFALLSVVVKKRSIYPFIACYRIVAMRYIVHIYRFYVQYSHRNSLITEGGAQSNECFQGNSIARRNHTVSKQFRL